MKAYGIIKLTAMNGESDNVQYRNKMYSIVGCFCAAERPHWKRWRIGLHIAKLIYCTRIAGRRQVTVCFMN